MSIANRGDTSRRSVAARLGMAALAASLASPAAAGGHVWRTYANDRYGYSLCYPADLFRPGAEPVAHDGIVFQGARGESLIVSAAYNTEPTTPADAAEAELKAVAPGAAVVYRAAQADWAVVSGVVGDKIVFVRQVARGDVLAGFELTYPASEKAMFDGVVQRLNGCLTLPAAAAAAEASPAEPADIVAALVKLDARGNAETAFDNTPNAFMRKTFTQAFNAAWANAMSHNKDEPVLDGDPITGEQGVTRVVLKQAKASEAGDLAVVSAELLITSEGVKEAHGETLGFAFKREAGVWKVDDIAAKGMDSMRAYFSKTYGK